MMIPDNIDDVVFSLIAREYGADVTKISTGSGFLYDLSMDSLDVIEFIKMVEDEFEISISDDEIDNLREVGDLTGMVRNKLSAALVA